MDVCPGDPKASRWVVNSFAIVPAAGWSERMGQPKLLLPWHPGGTVIGAVIAAWRASQVSHVVVVCRKDDKALIKEASAAGAQVVTPELAPPDMRSSVRHGLAFVRQQFAPSPSDAWLLAPADMPLLPSGEIDRLLAAHDPSLPRILALTYRGKRGHPVLFPWPMADEVDALAEDEGINVLLKRHAMRELESHDAAILADVDTPEDYRRLGGPGGSRPIG